MWAFVSDPAFPRGIEFRELWQRRFVGHQHLSNRRFQLEGWRNGRVRRIAPTIKSQPRFVPFDDPATRYGDTQITPSVRGGRQDPDRRPSDGNIRDLPIAGWRQGQNVKVTASAPAEVRLLATSGRGHSVNQCFRAVIAIQVNQCDAVPRKVMVLYKGGNAGRHCGA